MSSGFVGERAEVDVAIVGAGAAGLMAAIFAGRANEDGRKIVALDGSPKIGAKILIAGGGRCNVTHHAVSVKDFNGNRNLIRRVLKSFDVPATRQLFEEELGVKLKREDTGKLFPVSDRAITVLDALLGEVDRVGVDLRRGVRVETVERMIPGGFRLETSAGELSADRVILATGGKSVPKTGSDGAGYEMASTLGHTVSRTFPALVPLTTRKGHWARELKGVSHDVELLLRSGAGKVIHRNRGSMLFTHFGLSGPVVLDMSRHWIDASRSGRPRIEVNLMPGRDFAAIDRALTEAGVENHQLMLSSFLSRFMPARLAESVLENVVGTSLDLVFAHMTKDLRRSIAHAVTELPLPVVGDRGFDFAEVTAGGVPLTEIDTATMESRVCPSLYLCGEILDVDGRIGGFNFQWAWASGRLAGLSALRTGE